MLFGYNKQTKETILHTPYYISALLVVWMGVGAVVSTKWLVSLIGSII